MFFYYYLFAPCSFILKSVTHQQISCSRCQTFRRKILIHFSLPLKERQTLLSFDYGSPLSSSRKRGVLRWQWQNLWGKQLVWRKGRQLRGTRGPSRVGFWFIVWLCGSRCHGGKRLSPPTSCLSQRNPRCVPGHSNGHSYLWAGVMDIKVPTLECGTGDFFKNFI